MWQCLTLIMFVACSGQPVVPGITFDDATTATYDPSIHEIVKRYAHAFHVPEWVSKFNDLEIIIETRDKIVPCGDRYALGCTVYDGENHPIIMRTRAADSFNETTLPHELFHVFMCVNHGNCDVTHSEKNLWDEAEKVFLSMVNELKQVF